MSPSDPQSIRAPWPQNMRRIDVAVAGAPGVGMLSLMNRVRHAIMNLSIVG